MYGTPVWQMVREAVTSNGNSTVSNAEIKKYIFDHYGDVNEGTINAQIIVCCVNRQSRINYPENHKPRVAKSQYDFLYYVDRGLVALYEPDKHGQWEIALENGKLIVRRFDSSSEIFIPTVSDRRPRVITRTIRRRDIFGLILKVRARRRSNTTLKSGIPLKTIRHRNAP